MTKEAKKIIGYLPWAAALVLPLFLVALFEGLKGNKALMDGWVSGVMAPVEQFLGRLWSVFPFSVAEVLTALVLAGSVFWIIRAVVLVIRRPAPYCGCGPQSAGCGTPPIMPPAFRRRAA